MGYEDRNAFMDMRTAPKDMPEVLTGMQTPSNKNKKWLDRMFDGGDLSDKDLSMLKKQAEAPTSLSEYMGNKASETQGMEWADAPGAPDPTPQEVLPGAQPPAELPKSGGVVNAYGPLLRAKEKGLAQSRQLLANYKAQPAGMKSQIDYMPLMSLVDTWTGSKLAKGYKAQKGKAPQDVNIQMAKMYDTIGKKESDLAKTALNKEEAIQKKENMKVKRAWDEKLLRYKEKKAGGTGTRFDKRHMQRVHATQRKELDKINSSLTSQFSSTKLLGDAFGTREIGMIKPLLTRFAKSIGKDAGNIADKEAMRIMQDSIGVKIAELTQWATDNKGTKIPASTINPLIQIINRVKRMLVNDTKKVMGDRRMNLSLMPDTAEFMQEGAGLRSVYDITDERLGGMLEGMSGDIGILDDEPAQAGAQAGAQPGAALAPEDQEAVDWAKQNPGHPQAAKILQMHGM